MRQDRYATATAIQIGLVLLTVAVYARVPGFDFVGFDDPGYVVDRPEVLFGLTPASLAWAFTTTAQSNWHPLTWISLMIDARLGGGSPMAFHVTSVLFHVLNALLLLRLLWLLTGERWKSAWVAALFAVHPLHVESVAWIAERKDVLSTFFGFLAMLSYVAYVRRKGAWLYCLVLIFFALGLLSKPMLVTLPLLLLLLDFWPLGRLGPGVPPAGTPDLWRVLLEKLPLFGLAALSAAITVLAQAGGGSVISLDAIPLGQRIANAAVSYVVYGVDVIWPTGLAVPYPYSLDLLTPARVGFSALLLVAVTALVLLAARRFGYLFVGWSWYLVTLLPVIGVIQVGTQARADRYTYISVIGLFLIVAWGGSDLWNRVDRIPETWRRRFLAVAASLAVLALAVAGHRQTAHWRDTPTLFQRALDVTKNNVVAHNGLGHELLRLGRADEAMTHFREALRISPRYFEAQVNYAAALYAVDNFDGAIRHYETALTIDPAFLPGRVSLGDALLNQGRTQEAAAQYREVLRLDPGHASALRQLAFANLLLATGALTRGQVDEGTRLLVEAVRLDPSNVKARRNLGATLARQGRYAEAVEHLEEALRLDPSHEGARRNLERARSLAAAGR